MLILPFSDEPGTYKVFVVLEDDNVARCKAHDPAQIKLPVPGFEDKRLALVFIGYASTEDRDHVLALMQHDRPGEALRYLSNGFEFRPDKGDYDGPPLSLLDKGQRKQ